MICDCLLDRLDSSRTQHQCHQRNNGRVQPEYRKRAAQPDVSLARNMNPRVRLRLGAFGCTGSRLPFSWPAHTERPPARAGSRPTPYHPADRLGVASHRSAYVDISADGHHIAAYAAARHNHRTKDTGEVAGDGSRPLHNDGAKVGDPPSLLCISIGRHQQKEAREEKMLHTPPANSKSWLQGQARPGIRQAQDFTHHVQCIARTPPPMRPVIRIVAHRPNNTPHPRDRALAPERADTPGMGLCRHQDDGRPALAFERLGNGVHFRCRVRAIRLENADGIRRHAEMDQHALAIERFAHVGNPHRSEFRAGTRRSRHPNLRRPTLAIERRGFPRPHRHSAAENHDRISFPKWIFHDKPSANAQRAREYEKHESQENRNPKSRPDAPGCSSGLERRHDVCASYPSRCMRSIAASRTQSVIPLDNSPPCSKAPIGRRHAYTYDGRAKGVPSPLLASDAAVWSIAAWQVKIVHSFLGAPRRCELSSRAELAFSGRISA